MGRPFTFRLMTNCLTVTQVDQLIEAAKGAVGAVITRLEHRQPGTQSQ